MQNKLARSIYFKRTTDEYIENLNRSSRSDNRSNNAPYSRSLTKLEEFKYK